MPLSAEPYRPADALSFPGGAAGRGAILVSGSFAGTQVVSKCLLPAPSTSENTFIIGESSRADLPVSGPIELTLIDSVNDGFVLRFDPSWDGWVTTAESQRSLADLANSSEARPVRGGTQWEYRIPTHCTIQIELAETQLCIRPELRPPRLERPPLRLVPVPLRACLALSFALILGALAAISNIPDSERYLEDAPFSELDRLVTVRSQALERARAQNTAQESSTLPSSLAVDSTKESKRMDSADWEPEPIILPDNVAPDTREAAVYVAERSGIMGALRGLHSPELDKVVESIHFDASAENIESYGDLEPGDVDKATGAWGHGIRKIGPGSGDGKDWGTIKSKNYRLSSAQQRGDDYVAKALTRPHESSGPTVSRAVNTIIGSGLKYDVIRGQLGMRKRSLRRCFEVDEFSDEFPPSHLKMSFEITPSGRVGEARAPDVESERIRSCLENTLLSIRFPQPDDGEGIRVENFSLRI